MTDKFDLHEDTIDLDRRDTKKFLRKTQVEFAPLDLGGDEDSGVFGAVDSATVTELRRRAEQAEAEKASAPREPAAVREARSKVTIADLEADGWEPEQSAPPLQLNEDDDADEVRNAGLGGDVGVTVRARTIRSEGDDDPTLDADYEIVRKIGEGGIGVVYEARQASIDRRVAVKMLKSHGGNALESESGGIRARRKFFAEAVVTGDLDHPNIVPIYDLGTDEQGNAFYSMKAVSGTPWYKVLNQKTQAENLDILMHVADAIAFAHSRGVIHRDLKPENVMLGDFGEVLVMDWGLAITNDEFTKAGGTTKRGEFGGTPSYMAPEMTGGDVSKIGTHSDVYLLGAILYEIVTGNPPHAGSDVKDCLRAAGNNEIHPTDATGELVDIALKAMATHAWNRYASVADLQKAIRDIAPHAQSVDLARRAAADLENARRTDAHEDFLKAIYGFEESCELWPGNEIACRGIAAARLAYARSAQQKGDLDLAAHMLLEGDATHEEARRGVLAAQRERNAGRRSRGLGWAGSVLALLLVASVAYAGWLTVEHRELRAERDEMRFTGAGSTDVEQLQRERELAVQRVATLNEDVKVANSRLAALAGERDQALDKLTTAEAETVSAVESATRTATEKVRAELAEATRERDAALAAKTEAEQTMASLDGETQTRIDAAVAVALADAKKDATQIADSATDLEKQLAGALTARTLTERELTKAREERTAALAKAKEAVAAERAARDAAKQSADAEAAALAAAKAASAAEKSALEKSQLAADALKSARKQTELAAAAELEAKQAAIVAKDDAAAQKKRAEVELAKANAALATARKEQETALVAAREAERARDLAVASARKEVEAATAGIGAQTGKARDAALLAWIAGERSRIDGEQVRTQLDAARAAADAAQRVARQRELDALFAGFATDIERDTAKRALLVAELERLAGEFADQRRGEAARTAAEERDRLERSQRDLREREQRALKELEAERKRAEQALADAGKPKADDPKSLDPAPPVDSPITDPSDVDPPKADLPKDASDRYAFGPWTFNAQGGGFHFMKLEYKAQPTDTTYAFHYCIAYKNRPGFVYFYDPVAKEFWGRYEIAAAADANFSEIAPAQRGSDVFEIADEAFGPAGPLPKVPGAENATANIIPLPAVPNR